MKMSNWDGLLRLKRVFAVFTAILLVSATANPGLVLAVAPPPNQTSIQITSTPPDGCLFVDNEIIVSGTATADAPPGQLDQYAVDIDWGDGNFETVVQQGDFGVGQGISTLPFSGSHTYLVAGPYTITAQVYHQNPPGEDGDADATSSFDICVASPAGGTVTGYKFNDENGDGAWALSELGLSGWTVYIDLNDNDVLDGGEPSTLTDITGFYSLLATDDGSYTVREEMQLGWTQTYPVAGEYIVALSDGSVAVDPYNFGNWIPVVPTGGTVSGCKFDDQNNNGNWDIEEPKLSGWNFYHDANDNGSLDQSEQAVSTDDTGCFTFDFEADTDYLIREVGQLNWSMTYPLAGFYSGTVSGEAAIDDLNFGNHYTEPEIPTYSISGTKWSDEDNNGEWNNEEPPLEGWTIYLDENANGQYDDGEPLDITDSVGGYSFSGLENGPYIVREIQQDGWTQTFPNSDALPYAYAHSVEVDDENVEFKDFGNYDTPTPQTGGYITGLKWGDLDGNGVWDEGEVGLGGWTIFVDLNDNGVWDEGEPSTITGDDDGIADEGESTDSLGRYNLHILTDGSFKVLEVGQVGWNQTYPIEPTYQEVIVSGGMALDFNYNFGNQEEVIVNSCDNDISGKAFNDLNGNTVIDPEEPGLADWTLYLDVDNDNSLSGGDVSTTTDANGSYHFSDLPEGTYIIREVVKSGWNLIFPGQSDEGEYLFVVDCDPEFSISSFDVSILSVSSNGSDINFANEEQPTPPGGGGGSSGGGGGPTPPPTPTPTPPGEVLGDEILDPGNGAVAGASLPVTGFPIGAMLLTVLSGYLVSVLIGRRIKGQD